MGFKRVITHHIDGGIIENDAQGLGGSRHLLEIAYGKRNVKLLLDMGGTLNPVAGEETDPLRNIVAKDLAATLISHVHQDHNGEIVFLPKAGMNGNIYMTDFSKKATNIITNDNLRTQEETISAANKKMKHERNLIRKAVARILLDRGTGKTRQSAIRKNGEEMSVSDAEDTLRTHGIDPLKIKSEKDVEKYKPQMKTAEFDADDVKRLLDQIKTIPLHTDHEIVKDFVTAKFYDAGHIKGSVQILLKVIGNLKNKKDTLNMLYSGDIGRFRQPGKVGAPEIPKEKIDYLVVEGTYGDRLHVDREREKARFFQSLKSQKGLVLPVCFAIERMQEILDMTAEGIDNGTVKLRAGEKIYVDSRLAYDITKEYIANDDFHNPAYKFLRSPYIEWVNSPEQVAGLLELSKKQRVIIFCSGGMVENGSIMKYLHHATQSKNAKILLPGFQAPGTIGYRLLHGDFSQPMIVNGAPILHNRASIENFSFSGHADQAELMHYISHLNFAKYVEIAVVHGGKQRYELAHKIEQLFHELDKKKKPELRGLREVHVPQHNGEIITIKDSPYSKQ